MNHTPVRGTAKAHQILQSVQVQSIQVQYEKKNCGNHGQCTMILLFIVSSTGLTCTMIIRDIRLLNTVHSGKYLLCTSPTTAPQVSLQDLGLRCLAESDAITAMSSCTDTPVSRMNSFIGVAVRSNDSHCDSKAGPVLALVFSWLRSQISVHRPFECTLKKLCNLLRGTDVHEVTASSFWKSTP